ncbi:hypothetical protein ACER0A_011550 [Haloimpatiens sp. FM7315]|uniref:hypothetical protein n=1 Tax=Haloimpatiens sp. FM7315 TaxID=3298609 RepID=UPI0035A27780
MICVFCGEKGSGKTKRLINLANEKALINKGNLVYIDDDSRLNFELKNKIRFIPTEEFDLKDYKSFYAFLCGILSEDYDIDTVFIDGLGNIVDEGIHNAAPLFYYLEKISERKDVDFYINISEKENSLPEFVKKYIA